MHTLRRAKVLGFALLALPCLPSLATAAPSPLNMKVAGVIGPEVNVFNGFIRVVTTFQNINMDAGLTLPIPKYPNSSIEISPDYINGGSYVAMNISIADFLKNKGATLNPQTLPGGRFLPGVAAGVMPAIAFQIPQLANTVIYLGPTAIGFFIPVKSINLYGAIPSFAFYNNQSNKRIGVFAVVSNDPQGKNAGIFAMMSTTLLGIMQ